MEFYVFSFLLVTYKSVSCLKKNLWINGYILTSTNSPNYSHLITDKHVFTKSPV